jgi:TctA family transporter
MLEENFRRAMLLSRGSFGTFVSRPISGSLLAVIGAFIIWQFFSFLRDRRRTAAAGLPLAPLPQPAE